MRLTFLGTGPSEGVPQEGCDTKTCKKARKGRSNKNNRLQTSGLIEYNNKNILMNVSNDIKLQIQENKVKQVDAALITHGNDDAIGGLYELGQLRENNDDKLDLYCEEETWDRITDDFDKESLDYIERHIIEPYESFEVYGLTITPLRFPHSRNEDRYPYVGFKISNENDMMWAEDTSAPTHDEIPEKTQEYMHNLDLLVYDGAMGEGNQIYNHNTLNEDLMNRLLDFDPETVFFVQCGVSVPAYEDATDFVKSFDTRFNISYDRMSFNVEELREYVSDQLIQEDDVEEYISEIPNLDDRVLTDDHRILHAWASTLKRHDKDDMGGWTAEDIQRAHHKVVQEMERRGMKHNSPLDLQEFGLEKFLSNPLLITRLDGEELKKLHDEVHKKWEKLM